MSGEKTRKLYTLAKPSQAMRSRTICCLLTRLSGNILKLEHHTSFKKTEQMNYENSPQQI